MIPVRVSFAVDFAFDRTSNSRRAALWALAARITEMRPGTSKIDIASALYARERLGTTAVGGGVACPHTVLADQETTMIVMRRLEKPVEFDAPDGMGVDTLVALVGGRHDIRGLRAALLRLGRLAQGGPLRHQLRKAATQDEVAAVFIALGFDVQNDEILCGRDRAHEEKPKVMRGLQGCGLQNLALR